MDKMIDAKTALMLYKLSGESISSRDYDLIIEYLEVIERIIQCKVDWKKSE